MLQNKLSSRDKEEMYRQIAEYSFEPTIVHSQQKILYINKAAADFFKTQQEAVVGANVVDIFTEDYREMILERIRLGTEERQVGELMETTVHRFDGTTAEVDLYCHPVQFGETEAIQSIVRDITNLKETERKLTKLKNEIATPIVPIADGIAVLPLVGSVDGDRTNQLLEIIPKKVQGHQLEWLIVDVSGIYNIDEVVAEFLYKITSIMQLLGIQLVFTGIRPELAQKAVESRIDFAQLTTMSNVKEAIKRLTS
ncbi:PAS domain S-box protein [Planococcus salinus]|uniref:PAS domain S-box protein n=1 Tax=Planococcus salinus TaxID=1848460 RepID=A0A3M8P871_9BACL|nr:PAS domain S-box protein [Planococcus salinus]RNF39838.1 PAS domain S-box protein [Planococcus salinus]